MENKKRVTVDIPNDLYEMAMELADSQDRSFSSLIRIALTELIKQQPK